MTTSIILILDDYSITLDDYSIILHDSSVILDDIIPDDYSIIPDDYSILHDYIIIYSKNYTVLYFPPFRALARGSVKTERMNERTYDRSV